MNKTTAALVAVILVLGGSFAWYASNHPPRGGEQATADADSGPVGPRTLRADIAAAGLRKLAFKAGVGEVRVTASPDDQVHLRVTLRQKEEQFLWFVHWRSGGSVRNIEAATIAQEKSGDTLTLSLSYPDHDEEGSLKQDWELQMPVRLALDADMKVGELTIEGPAGGVDARLNVGELAIDVPKGHLSASVNVGEIRATSGSSQHGHIELSSNVGEAVLTLAGASAGEHQHGGLGNHVSLDGNGPDDMRLSINVGEASLHVDGEVAKK